jgi:hypothetical protein
MWIEGRNISGNISNMRPLSRCPDVHAPCTPAQRLFTGRLAFRRS